MPLNSGDALGSSIVYAKSSDGKSNLYRKNSSGAGQEELLLDSAASVFPTEWSAAAGAIFYLERGTQTRFDIWSLPLAGDRKPRPVLKTEFDERGVAVSPDGKYLAYASDESGRYEVYIQTYPPAGAKWQVSKNGGFAALWRRDGKEIFFLSTTGAMMAAEVSSRPAFRVGTPVQLFESGLASVAERYSVTADGKRFLLAMPMQENAGSSAATLVQNVFERARR